MSSRLLQGTPISPGLVIGMVRIYQPQPLIIAEEPCRNSIDELTRLENARIISQNQLKSLIINKKSVIGEEELKIFEAHLMFLDDPEFLEQVQDKIKSLHWDASKALFTTSNEFADMLSKLPDPYLAARSQDVQDMAQRFIKNLVPSRESQPLTEAAATLSSLTKTSLNADSSKGDSLNKESLSEGSLIINSLDQIQGILAVQEITPSMVAELNPQRILGVLSAQGGSTSHAAILLKNLEIPTIFGLNDLIQTLTSSNKDCLENRFYSSSPSNSEQKRVLQNQVMVDACTGTVTLSPSSGDQLVFQKKILEYQNEKSILTDLKSIHGATQDGVRIQLNANIGSLKDLNSIEKFNAEGIGLFRTEFLFLDRSTPPSEEEQYHIYSTILKSMRGKKVIIRTLDIGGDKIIPYLKLPHEDNPFLGLRGLRLCLSQQELFRTQIRALLRASQHGHLSLMYPMVTQLSEWQCTQKLVTEEFELLQQKKMIPASVNLSSIRFGIMIEVPAAALMAEAFARVVDFFSIGTNDLIQYTCACDRLNTSVSSLYSHTEPSVLRLIHQVVQAATKYHKEVSLCGEMGGDTNLTPFLIGVGLRSLSMSSQQIPHIKRKLQKLNEANCRIISEKILQASDHFEVQHLLTENLFEKSILR